MQKPEYKKDKIYRKKNLTNANTKYVYEFDFDLEKGFFTTWARITSGKPRLACMIQNPALKWKIQS